MQQNRIVRRSLVVPVFAALLGLVTAGPVAAAAVSLSHSNAILSISGPTLEGLTYQLDTTGSVFTNPLGGGVVGAEADPSGRTGLDALGNTILTAELLSDVLADSAAPPSASAFSSSRTDALVVVDNFTADDVTLNIRLDVEFDIIAQVANTLSEDAFGDVQVALVSSFAGELASVIGRADALFGPGSDTLFATLFDGDILVAAGDTLQLELVNIATAQVVSAVPVPAALPLLASALLMGVPMSRRRVV